MIAGEALRMRLAGSRTVVTGASGGLGAAIATACTARGARVILTGRRQDLLHDLAARLGADVAVADLAVPSSLSGLLAEVGEIDILVSNAALPADGRLDALSIADVDEAIYVNLRAPVYLAKHFVAGMIERRRGHIVFVSSLAAAFPTPGLSVYNATKAALSSLALSLRAELAPSGVGVSVVHPGPIRDAGMWADTGLATPPGIRTRSPKDVGNAVVEAIERNRANISVASFALRAGAVAARTAPVAMSRAAATLGAGQVTAAMSNGLQRSR